MTRGLAIRNNRDLYRAVFESQGLSLEETEDAYFCRESTPPLYSNLATKRAGWRPDEVFGAIGERAAREGWHAWSVKDSFSQLDLTPHGLRVLFDASWITLDAADAPKPQDTSVSIAPVRSPQGLRDWIRAWGDGEETGAAIFGEAMLEDPSVEFVTCVPEEGPVCAALLNQTGDVVGVSNFFSDEVPVWRALLTYALSRFGARGVVGYASEEDLAIARSLGFEVGGDLRIWICRA